MRVLVIFGTKVEVIESAYVPRLGERVDMFCTPLPEVKTVIAWPSKSRIESAGISEHVDAIVMVR